MPRTRKMYSWTVSFRDKLFKDIRSKTLRGACCKVFKKFNLCKADHPEYNPYGGTYPGVYCVRND